MILAPAWILAMQLLLHLLSRYSCYCTFSADTDSCADTCYTDVDKMAVSTRGEDSLLSLQQHLSKADSVRLASTNLIDDAPQRYRNDSAFAISVREAL